VTSGEAAASAPSLEHLVSVPPGGLSLPVASLLFLRHGRTAHNARRLVQGHLDVPLDDVGREQARAAAMQLVAAGVVRRIVASDLTRAADTAHAVAVATGAPLTLEPALRERDFGEFADGPVQPDFWLRDVEGIEPMDTFVARVAAALRHHVRDTGCLVVAHGGVLRVLGHLLAASLPLAALANARPLWLTTGPWGWTIRDLAVPEHRGTPDSHAVPGELPND
jgi:broad specificity phosphatase PhoE